MAVLRLKHEVQLSLGAMSSLLLFCVNPPQVCKICPGGFIFFQVEPSTGIG